MIGKIFVVTGPSGAGKDSVIERARELGLTFGTLTTTSTRPMRPGESEGLPYYFVTQSEFEEKVKNGKLLEWAHVYGNYYGCTREEVERVQKNCDVVILKVDLQGARTYKKLLPHVVTIFVQPPSVEYLEKRLVRRATDAPEVIAQRLEVAYHELQNLDEWDYIIRNDENKLDGAAQELLRIIKHHLQKS